MPQRLLRPVVLLGTVMMLLGGQLGCDDAQRAGEPFITEDASPPSADSAPDRQMNELAGQIQFTPERAVYAPGDSIRLSWVPAGGPSSDSRQSLEWSVSPPTVARMRGPDQLSLLTDGRATVTGCQDGQCLERTLRVSSDLTISIEEPARGAMLDLPSPEVRVRGTVSNAGEGKQVAINGVPAVFVNERTFEASVPLSFGINRIRTEASDLRNPNPVLDARTVLWADRYAPPSGNEITATDAAILEFRETVLDTNSPPLSVAQGRFQAQDFAQFVQILFAQGDFRSSLDLASYRAGESLEVAIEAVELPTPEVEFEFTGLGTELFLTLRNAQVETSGFIATDSGRIPLDGTLSADISAFVLLEINFDGGISFALPQYDLAVTGLVGHYEESLLNDLLRSFDSQLSLAARRSLELFGGDLMQNIIPTIMETSINQVFDILETVPVLQPPAMPGLNEMAFDIGLVPNAVRHSSEQAGVSFLATTRLRPTNGEVIDTAGVALGPALTETSLPGDAVVVTASLDVFNVITHAAWWQGVFSGRPELPPPFDALLGQIELESLLPPFAQFLGPSAGPEPHLIMGELLLRRTPMGETESDLYSLHLSFPVTPYADGGTLGLRAPETISIEAQLLDSRSAEPMDAQNLARLITGVAWPPIRDALNSALNFGIDSVSLDQSLVTPVSQTLSNIRFVPLFPSSIRFGAHSVSFPGQIRFEGEIVPPPAD